MTRRRLRVEHADGATLERGIREIQRQLDVSPDFPPDVVAAAERAAANPRLPDRDRTDIPLVTIDPADAQDLDQAMFIERTDVGHRVYYAIADVGAFVEPGDPVDVEAHKRGETFYGADSRVPLHPPVLSEGAASLLPDQVRPALLWVVDLDEAGEGITVDVTRARVRSRARYSYAQVQEAIFAGSADPMFDLLQEVGERRKHREQVRGGVSLPLPEQEVVADGDRWDLRFRAPLPVERWNEQISLLTGMAAAHLMLYAEVGLLRTLPEPESRAVLRLHRTAAALDIDWPAEMLYPDFVRTLDPKRPSHAAMLVGCTSLLRGAGYVAFEGVVPEQPEHSALASEYAHVTAPLRRLCDRYTGEVCVALCADEPVPDWVRAALPQLPETMRASGRRANQYESAVVNLAEAHVLASRVGETFEGAIVDVDHDAPDKGVVVLRAPAIEASVTSTAGQLPLGQRVRVTLVEADVDRRLIRFEHRP
ncbi:MAG TPA: RNB domain-containing ribonuclease [Nocardioidaceae bacterium]|nr:RNB domain-containing ribonuclease [Nocardioidaceae bacterium]